MSAGFAVRIGNTIAINSVAATERAAMVNFLVAVAGVMVTQGWSDDDITDAFVLSAPIYNARLIPITVTEA